DGSQSRVYIDGHLVGSAVPTYGPKAGTATLKIGARGDDAAYTFNGLIDEVRYTSGAVYTTDFVPQSLLTVVPGSVGLWKFDGQTAADSSGHGNNGVLRNGATFSTDVPGSSAKITPVAVTASNTLSGSSPSLAVDGDLNTSWNSGGFFTQWIQLDL